MPGRRHANKPAIDLPVPRSSRASIDWVAVGQGITAAGTGDRVTRAQVTAWLRFVAAFEAQQGKRLYESVPKARWLEWSGRQTRTVNDQAEKYGLPIGGRVISIPELARSLHDFLAQHGARLALLRESDDALEDPDTTGSPALERLREVKAALAELDLAERRGELVRRIDLTDPLARLGQILRDAGDTLRRRFGPEAYAVIDDALTAFSREIEDRFGQGAAA